MSEIAGYHEHIIPTGNLFDTHLPDCHLDNDQSVNLHTNPLSPHDALKHHFTSLKTQLISLQPRVLEGELP